MLEIQGVNQFECNKLQTKFVSWNKKIVVEVKLHEENESLENTKKVHEVMKIIAKELEKTEIDGLKLCAYLFNNLGIKSISEVDRIVISKGGNNIVQKSGNYFAIVEHNKMHQLICQMLFKQEMSAKHIFEEYYYQIPMAQVRKGRDGRYMVFISKKDPQVKHNRPLIEKNAKLAIERFEMKIKKFIKIFV